MSVTVIVMYPDEPGSKFDMDYYLETHGPLVHEHWGDLGLNDLKVTKGVATPDPDVPAPYRVVTILDFESLDAFRNAAARKGAEVMGDIPNFTDITPVIQINENMN